MELNNDQKKHIAGSLRAIGVAQFVVIGYKQFQNIDLSIFDKSGLSSIFIITVSSLAYLFMEYLAVITLEDK